MPRRSRRTAAALAAALGLAACAPTPEERARDLPWVIATTVDLGGVNELIAPNTRFTHELIDLQFLGLLAEQADFADRPPSFEPSLAESWTTSPDGRTITFRLRPDARWSDGRPVTAADVVFSHRAQTAAEVAWPYAESKEAIVDVVAVDPKTVVYRLARGYPHQLVDVNDGVILPEHVWSRLPLADWRRAGDWFREHRVASGPYRLAEWRAGVELVLERNPHHWAAPPPGAPARAVFRVIPDPAALVEQLLAGAFDFYDGLSALDVARVERAPGMRVIAVEGRQFDYLGWNQRRPPFDDVRVRQAMTLAIDRPALVDALHHGHAQIAVGPVPAAFWARDRELEPWPYDPAAARALLAEAGFADADGDGVVERDGRELAFELITNAGNRIRADAMVLVQEQLARVGVAVRPRAVEMQSFVARLDSRDFDAALSGWAVDTTLDLRPYFHSNEIRADGLNFVGCSIPELDRLLDATRTASDLEATRPLYRRIQRLLHDQQPYTFLWEPQRLVAVRAGIAGVEPDPLSALDSLPRWRRTAAGDR
jgi:peptide/nickel transport system substrate-binding protein